MQQHAVEGFRLSHQQQRLWQLQQESSAYRTQCALMIEGPLKSTALQAALQSVVTRHEILRTAFRSLPSMDMPLQVIVEDSTITLKELDLRKCLEEEQKKRLDEYLREGRKKAFDYEQGRVIDAGLVALTADKHVLVINASALCVDKESLSKFVGELVEQYEACVAGNSEIRETVQYADFSEWQHELLESDEAAVGREFWVRERLLRPPPLRLPGESCGIDDSCVYQPQIVTVTIGAGTARRLEALASGEMSTTATALLACWQSLLWRLTAEPVVVVQTGFDCGKYDDLHESLGLFTKYLPLRCKFSEVASFRDIIQGVDGISRKAYEWHEYYMPRLPHDTPAGDEEPPFYDLGFECQLGEHKYRGAGLRFTTINIRTCTEYFKLHLNVTQIMDTLLLSFYYDPGRFDAATVARFSEQYLTLLEAAVESPDAPVGALALLGEKERCQLLVEWQGAPSPFPHDRCLHQLIEDQAARTPERTAVVYEEEELSYAELNARANQLAHQLCEFAVGPDSLVGIMMERSIEVVVAFLAVLKAGGAYVPLDPSYPQERISFMLEDAAVSVLLTRQHLVERWPELRSKIIAVDSEWEAISQQSAENLQNVAQADNLAYVIYTSGSTGWPKGVMIQHRSVLNLSAALEQAVYFKHPDVRRVTLNAPLSFDASVKQLIQLARGRTLCVVPEWVRGDGVALSDYISRRRVDLLDCTPAQLRLMEAPTDSPQAGSTDYPQVVLVGGEAIDPQLWSRLASDHYISYYNVYGPTECTVDATCARVSPQLAVPTIGRSLLNTRALVLDERGQLAPVGVAGELCLGGEGVARGYLGRERLTAEKFIADAFSAVPGARLYRTGDLARYLPDGTLEYVGRIDRQVKLRGYRIEPGEIEAAIASHAGVRACAVVVREDEPGDQRLVAYVVTDREVTIGDWQEYLQLQLPPYMLPATFVAMATLPLTRHGKVDWQALPAPDVSESVNKEGFRAARTPVEEVLAGLWAEVLRVREVGVDENFFKLGGHSLLATQLMSRVRDAFRVEVPLRKLFEGPTVAELAAHIEDGIIEEIEKMAEEEVLEML
jgi:amino acid adenylation domain-containing protein